MTKISSEQQLGRALRKPSVRNLIDLGLLCDYKRYVPDSTFNPDARVELIKEQIDIKAAALGKGAAQMCSVYDVHPITSVRLVLPYFCTNEEERQALKKACRTWLYDHQSEYAYCIKHREIPEQQNG